MESNEKLRGGEALNLPSPTLNSPTSPARLLETLKLRFLASAADFYESLKMYMLWVASGLRDYGGLCSSKNSRVVVGDGLFLVKA